MSAAPAFAQTPTVLRISSPAVRDDWHGKMWDVFKDALNASSPKAYDVQINLNGALFKQGTEPTAMARGNLEMASISAFDIAKQVPEFSVFTAGYVIRDPKHQQKVFNSPLGDELFKTVSDKMGVTVLATAYLGTRELNLRDTRTVNTPADLKGVKLRMPGSKEWLFLGETLGATATPLAFGEVRRPEGMVGGPTAFFIGLPGNPVSSFVTFLLFVRPFILRLQGVADVAPKRLPMRADFALPKGDRRNEFLRARINANGGLDLFPNQSSGVLTSTVWGDGLIDNPPNQPIAQGDVVSFLPFAGLV